MNVAVPFTPGRMDALEEWTDAQSFEALRPVADGFRNYYHESHFMAPEEALVDKAHLLRLSAPEMTVLVGGMRVLGANAGGSQDGVFTHRVGVLSNDFFVNLLDMKNEWTATEHKSRFQGLDRKTRQPTWTATRVDLIFGSQSELRAQAEVYGMADGNEVRARLRQGLGQGDERRPDGHRQTRRSVQPETVGLSAAAASCRRRRFKPDRQVPAPQVCRAIFLRPGYDARPQRLAQQRPACPAPPSIPTCRVTTTSCAPISTTAPRAVPSSGCSNCSAMVEDGT